jgi:pantoate--beta-alanine ligase
MILLKKAGDLRNYLDKQQENKKIIGFVPTMGALHEGHISLIRDSRSATDITVCSIFINPAQFNDPDDFKKYPVSIESDITKLETAGCDVVFLPAVAEIYPAGMESGKHYELGTLETILEGKYRPGHFQGVCLVVERLFQIVKPDILFMGQKDYQQCMVIRKLLELMKPGYQVRMEVSPTLREPDGLAMSSRNMRLDQEQRQKATTIYKALDFIRAHLKAGDTREWKDKAKQMLEENGFRVDYVEIADAATLETVNNWDGEQKLVTLAAAFLGDVRLIDNLVI